MRKASDHLKASLTWRSYSCSVASCNPGYSSSNYLGLSPSFCRSHDLRAETNPSSRGILGLRDEDSSEKQEICASFCCSGLEEGSSQENYIGHDTSCL